MLDLYQFLGQGYNLVLLFFFLELVFWWKSKKVPLDYDTSNHVYLGWIWSKNCEIFSSYRPGVKLALPKIYYFGFKFLKMGIYGYRFLNAGLFLACFLLLMLQLSEITNSGMAYLLLLFLLIHSAWVNFSTSAAEFYETFLLILALSLPTWGIPAEISWLGQLILIALMGYGFKFTSFIYVLPCSFYSDIWRENMWLGGIGWLALMFFSYWVFKSGAKKSNFKTYRKTRSFLHPKNTRFLIMNPVFCCLIACGIYLAIKGTHLWSDWILIGCAILVFFIQKMYMTYFFYPLLMLSSFVIIKNQSFMLVSLDHLEIFTFYIFFTHSFVFLMLPSKFLMSFHRLWVMLSGGSVEFIRKEKEQVDWLKANIPEESTVYLWGSHVALLLQAKLLPVENTYYSHNHIYFWSLIEDRLSYYQNLVNERKPKYIIESQIIDNCSFGQNENYHKIVEIGGMNVYKIQEKQNA